MPIFFIWSKILTTAKLSLGATLKTYFATGFTITSAAAQERRIVFPSSAMFLMAMVSPLVDGPIMAKTFSSSISCLAKETAFSGLPPESLTTSSTLLPMMPPLALMSSTSISRVRASGAPRLDAGPVTDRMAPTLSVSPANACVRVRIESKSDNTSNFMHFTMASPLRSAGDNDKTGSARYSDTPCESIDTWLFFEHRELAVLHGEHVKGVEAQAVVIGGRHGEDARRADQALDVLDRRPDLFLVRPAGILNAPFEEEHGVVSVAAEGAHVFLVFRLILFLIVNEHGLLRVLVRECLGHEKPAGRENHTLGSRARRFHVSNVAETMALEDGHREADLPGVLDHDGLGRFDGPVDDRLNACRLYLRHFCSEVRCRFVINL